MSPVTQLFPIRPHLLKLLPPTYGSKPSAHDFEDMFKKQTIIRHKLFCKLSMSQDFLLWKLLSWKWLGKLKLNCFVFGVAGSYPRCTIRVVAFWLFSGPLSGLCPQLGSICWEMLLSREGKKERWELEKDLDILSLAAWPLDLEWGWVEKEPLPTLLNPDGGSVRNT